MSPSRGDAEARRTEILDAALRVFGQYGYRRTSVDDIAREAGIAKGTVYLSFASKEEVFQALAERLSQRMLTGAEAASHRSGTTADKLAAMHAAWFGTYAETISRSPHAAELLDAKHRLSAGLAADGATRYRRLVRDVLAEADATGELDLEHAGLTADTASELLIAAARGLEPSPDTPAAYQRSLGTQARIMIAGLSGRPPPAMYRRRRHEAASRPSNWGNGGGHPRRPWPSRDRRGARTLARSTERDRRHPPERPPWAASRGSERP
jgi:TetR/AcrR family transcriptional regulator, regulator of autoinduction and epiphytic fitness